ncbi:hypothetical protein [Hydrogenophaga laconesensis]|uniref:Uncharacterized protein n=1 Tax=Hydrogenophaga laconesensis TaxID=1805971 RepID=A0ABU1V6Z5_9BURK|nr:hypothetical protein [Hydrogenophaga laconesensis]MDR7093195.1 hypothetical protein [Hydrogenophaga laconesensis]
MQPAGASAPPPMLFLLTEFATLDAPWMATGYLRKVLLLVYANTDTHYPALSAERHLARQLLSCGAQIGNRFAHLFTQELNGRHSSPVRSNNVHRLSRRIQDHAHDEAAALERILGREIPGIQLRGTAFDPICLAQCLEGALQGTLELNPLDKDTVFRSWSGLFAETVRESYIQYIQVLLNGGELAPKAQQDFVDTVPFSIGNRRDPPAPRPPLRRPPSREG